MCGEEYIAICERKYKLISCRRETARRSVIFDTLLRLILYRQRLIRIGGEIVIIIVAAVCVTDGQVYTVKEDERSMSVA